MIRRRPHPVWSLLKCVLLLNVLAGFVACAYNIQIGMGIVSGTVILMVVSLLLRIIGICPDRVFDSFPRAPPPPPTRRPTVIQKHEYILVSNPDRTISVGTRVLAQQPSASAYPPPY